MPKAFALSLLLGLALLAAGGAQAQLALKPYVGFNTADGAGLLVGIGGEFGLPLAAGTLNLALQPGIEYVFVDADGTYLQADANVIARFGAPGASIAPFAGAGLGVGIFSNGDSNTELGFNLLGGVAFPGALQFGEPFAQARYSLIGEFDALSIMGGFRIPLGTR